MKILINTNYNSAGSRVCVEDLSVRFQNAGYEVTRNDWDNYQNYDLVLFMSPDSQVRKAKEINPNITVGLMDPKITPQREPEVRSADFLLVSSLEQREFFLKYNKNIVIYYMFPEMKRIEKEHKDKEKIIIGYHGNKKHLEQMKDVVWALDELIEKYNIELYTLYNIKGHGQWERGLPKKCPVKHLQWAETAYYDEFRNSDIGIIPARVPIYHFKGFNVRKKYDYIVRFKYSNNPGRVYPFIQLGVPIVADFTPSYCQIIKDNYSGMLVGSREGWYRALEKLIVNSGLRSEMSGNLEKYVDNNCSPEINFKKFNEYLLQIV